MLKKIMIALAVIIIIIAGFFIYSYYSLKPLPEAKRNISTTDVKMLVTIKDSANRTAIVRTYTKEEYDKMNENKIEKLKNTIKGNIEGDIPAVILENGKGKIEFSFEKNENKKDTSTSLIPADTPEIRMSVLETIYSSQKPIEFTDTLTETGEKGKYLYEIKRHLNTEPIEYLENKKAYFESIFIEVSYKIDGKDYISFFAVNVIEEVNK